jgi:hypothetical protein
MTAVAEMIGEKFGEYVVIGRAKNSNHGQAMWLCRCSCGVERVIHGTHLRLGRRRMCHTCACRVRRGGAVPSYYDLTGKRFGLWTVVRRIGAQETKRTSTMWLCRCECGFVKEVDGQSLRVGNTTRCKTCTRIPDHLRVCRLCRRSTRNYKLPFMCETCCRRGLRNGNCGTCGHAMYRQGVACRNCAEVVV